MKTDQRRHPHIGEDMGPAKTSEFRDRGTIMIHEWELGLGGFMFLIDRFYKKS